MPIYTSKAQLSKDHPKVLMFIFGGIFSLIGSKDNNESSCGCILLFIVVALIWYAGSQVLHIFS